MKRTRINSACRFIGLPGALGVVILLLSGCADERVISDQRFVTRSNATIASEPTAGGTHAGLCRPCRTDGDCSPFTLGATCRPISADTTAGRFCATPCGNGNPCPNGFDCNDGRCLATSRNCPCTNAFEGAVTSCAFNIDVTTCNGTRTCSAQTLGDCIPDGGSAPECTGSADDCSGITSPDERARIGQPCDGDDADACEEGVWVCRGSALFCNDSPTSRVERCNGEDDDCDGLEDEDFTTLGTPCDGADADECKDGLVVCDPTGNGVICTDDGTSKVEICNGLDDDCNGLTDDGLNCTPATSRVCYPGTAFDYSLCFDLVAAATVTDAAYTYPTSADARFRAPDFLLDLQVATGSTRLAANFRLDEFMQTAKGRYGVFRPATVAHWQRIRATLGVPLVVSSGYWSPGRNETADVANQFSRHIYGDAADVTANGAVTLEAIRAACTAEGADFTQVYTSHVHCDWRDEAHTNDFWLATPQAAVWPGNNGHRHDEGDDADKVDDPWTRVWGDVEVQVLNSDETQLTARWGESFDEGDPWVSWEVTTADGNATMVIEPETTLIVARGSHVRWRIGGIIEGQLDVP